LYMMPESTPKMIAGIHTEICGGNAPASANDRNIIKNKIKMNERAKPSAIWKPVPPLLFREETMTPMKVRMKIEKGDEYRVYFSTS